MNKISKKPKLRFPWFTWEWEEKKIGEVITENPKSKLNVNQSSKEGLYPFFTSWEWINRIDDYIVEWENLFMNTGWKVWIKYYDWKVNYSGDVYSFKTNKLNTKFLYYGIQNNLDDIEYNFFTWTGLKHLSKTDFKKHFKIKCPTSLKEQEKITNFLSEVDKYVEEQEWNLVRQRELLKKYLKWVMQKIFSQELRFPWFTWEWEEKKIGEVLKLKRWSSPRPISKYLTDDSKWINWIKISDTNNTKFITQTKQKILIEWANKSRFVNKGDIIIANSMSFWKAYELKINWCIYDGWFVVKEYNRVFTKDFLLYLLNSEIVQRQYKRMTTWWVVNNICSSIVNSVKIPIPTSLKEQEKIAEFLSQIESQIESINRRIDILKKWKQGLLQSLFVKE